jgi:5-methylcytosine-specific restriction enzyme subunit McrC
LPPLEVSYDEFTEDIEENRLIKAALLRLGRMRIRFEPARRSLRHFDTLLERVGLVSYDPRRLSDVVYTRLNEHYRSAVELAKLILRFGSFELRHGRVRASAFLVDMNQVFEDFVVVALRERLGATEHTFPQGAKGRRLFLDQARKVGLEPDISWWAGDSCVFLGDIKYKEVSAVGVEHPDLYQLLSYVVAADLPGGLLIYGAGGREPVVHTVARAGKSLEVVALDLTASPESILEQVVVLADKIRWVRSAGVERGEASAG